MDFLPGLALRNLPQLFRFQDDLASLVPLVNPLLNGRNCEC